MLKRFCALLLLVCCCSVWALPAGVYLTDAEVQAIRLELRQMSENTTRLQNELNAQRQRSVTLLETSARLQERLELVLTKLELSQASLETSEAELTALLTELAILRTEYSALWESWTLQKNEAQKWKRLAAAGWISAGSFLLGGVIWGLMR